MSWIIQYFFSFMSVYFTQHIIFRAHSCCTVYQNHISFFRMHNISLFVYVTFCLSIYLLTDIWFVHFLAIVNNAAVTADIQVSVWVPAFNSFGHRPRNGIAGSYVHPIFNFQKNCLFYSFTDKYKLSYMVKFRSSLPFVL